LKYDPAGRRIQKSFTTGVNPPTTTSTNYLYDGDNDIEEVDTNGSVLATLLALKSDHSVPERTYLDEPLKVILSSGGQVFMPEYRPIHSPFGALWLHSCPALDHGPDWAQRERLLIDAGASKSRLTFQGRPIPFHGHLFKRSCTCCP